MCEELVHQAPLPPVLDCLKPFSTSLGVGGLTSVRHSGWLEMVDKLGVSEVQLNCSVKCFAHLLNLLD